MSSPPPLEPSGPNNAVPDNYVPPVSPQGSQSQSGDGHSIPRPTKRHHRNPDENDSYSDDETPWQGQNIGSGGQVGPVKRL
ncbi:hypothetical protein FRC07_001536, partial [Ceratobasidium sp. 392]